jgi:hypothetical protein
VKQGANFESIKKDIIQDCGKSGNLEIIKYLVEQGFDINSNNEILRVSAEKGHLEADIHADNDVAVKVSATKGNVNMMKFFLENGADIYTDDAILKSSAKNLHVKLFEYLIFDCNMVVKEETLEYFQQYKFLKTLVEIIQIRDLHNKLNEELNNKQPDNLPNIKKSKRKI